MREVLLFNYLKLSKKKTEMRIHQLGPNYKRKYPLPAPKKIWKVHS